jgi:hypothetical protein
LDGIEAEPPPPWIGHWEAIFLNSLPGGTMTNSSTSISSYPLLESILRQKGLTLQGIYSGGDAARIFGVSIRTIQDWCREGKLRARDLPGRGRFLSTDLEAFLENSLRAGRVSYEN